MAASRQELAIRQILLTLATVPEIAGTPPRVFRERKEAFRGQLPAIVVYPTSAARSPDTTCRDTWRLRIQCDILVAGGPTSALTDPIWTSMVPLLMADQSVGGNAVGIELWPDTEGGPPAIEWEPVEGDNDQGVMRTAWLLRVRTMESDVTR